MAPDTDIDQLTDPRGLDTVAFPVSKLKRRKCYCLIILIKNSIRATAHQID